MNTNTRDLEARLRSYRENPVRQYECITMERYRPNHIRWVPKLRFMTYGRCRAQWKMESSGHWQRLALEEMRDAYRLGDHNRPIPSTPLEQMKHFHRMTPTTYWIHVRDFVDPDFHLPSDSTFAF